MKRALAARKVRGPRAAGRVEAAAATAAATAAVTGDGGITKPVYLKTSVVPLRFRRLPETFLGSRNLGVVLRRGFYDEFRYVGSWGQVRYQDHGGRNILGL